MAAVRKDNELRSAIERLDDLFARAFSANHPAALDWARIRFALKKFVPRRRKGKTAPIPVGAEVRIEA